MKKILLPSILVFLSSFSLAQPILTSVTSVPSPGYQVVSYSGTAPATPGVPGPNANWDFSNINQSTPVTTSWVACSATSDCSSFPGTTVVAQAGNKFVYYIGSVTGFSIKGTLEGTGANMVKRVYSNTQDVFQFPISYGASFVDSFIAAGAAGANPYFRDGKVVTEADGWGTLKTPTGTYTNVLRLHITETYRDSNIIGGNAFVIENVMESYVWYSPQYRDYLLNYNFGTINSVPIPEKVAYTNPVPNSVEGTSKSQDVVKVYPNPVKGNLHISVNSEKASRITVEISDLMGRQVLVYPEKGYPAGEQNVTLETAFLSKGVYLLKISTSEGLVSVKKIEIL